MYVIRNPIVAHMHIKKPECAYIYIFTVLLSVMMGRYLLPLYYYVVIIYGESVRCQPRISVSDRHIAVFIATGHPHNITLDAVDYNGI